MKRTDREKNSRFALVIFIALVVFCLMQLTWWIVFQIHQGHRMEQLQKDMLVLQSDTVSPEQLQEIESASHHRVVMFISEGSFFVALILFGAYLIYRTLQRSEDLKRRQQNFLHAVTHEFRTPLTSLRLYLETLQSGKTAPEKSRDMIDRMLDDTDRLEAMIDNVLQAGHFGRSEYRLNLSETDLTADVQEYLDGMEPYVKRNGGRMTRELAPDIRVKSDYQALGMALRALIDNALKYSTPDKRELTVSLRRNGDRALLSVADNGIGIAPGEQERIFDRFYRVGDENTRTVKGTGLGLYLARQIVEAHHGDITVTSAGIDGGAQFTIALPVRSS